MYFDSFTLTFFFLIFNSILEGTMFVYYALFGPLVYWSFLKDFFAR